MPVLTDLIADGETKPQGFLTRAVDTWFENVEQWLGRPALGGVQGFDPTQAVDRYFDYVRQVTEQVVELNRSYVKTLAGAMSSVQGAVREQADGLSRVAREQVGAATTLVREQADDVQQAAAEQAEAVERSARREAQQARRAARTALVERYRDLTKVELQDELAQRDLPRTGNVEELRQRLIDAELQPDGA
jgi:hypothetical protein